MRRHSDTLRGAKRRRKRGLRGENGLSEAITRCLPVLICLPVIFKKNPSFPGHAPGKDTLRAANAATERGLTGENARANVVSGRALSPVKIKIPVASADMRRHSDTLRGAQRRRKRGLRGENRISKANSVVFPSDHSRIFDNLCQYTVDNVSFVGL